MGDTYNPKRYFDEGRTWPDKTDLGSENMDYLRSGGMISILDEAGKPYKVILLDQWDEFRSGPVENEGAVLAYMMFGVPVAYHASPEFKKQFEDKIKEMSNAPS